MRFRGCIWRLLQEHVASLEWWTESHSIGHTGRIQQVFITDSIRNTIGCSFQGDGENAMIGINPDGIMPLGIAPDAAKKIREDALAYMKAPTPSSSS